MRMGQLCAHLLESGSDVTYWTSSFNHVEKRTYARTTVVEMRGALKLVRLRAIGYRTHVSLARFVDQAFVANEFRKQASKHSKPDLIICSFPTIEIASAAVSFGKRHRIPVIVDVRDMWPDLLAWMFPRWLQPIMTLLMFPYQRIARQALGSATSVTSITDRFLTWSLAKAGRPRRAGDAVISFGRGTPQYSAAETQAAETFWKEAGVCRSGRPIVLFVGSFSRSLDIRPIIRTARLFDGDPSSPLFVLCGAGDRDSLYRAEAAGLRNVVMPGWINGCQIHAILQMSSIAISPLVNRFDHRSTINNKFVEYLSGGVPIIVSPADSYGAELVEQRDCGRGFTLGEDHALAALLREILADPTLLRRWRRNARAFFDDQFTEARISQEWDAVIAHTLASAGSVAS